MWKNIVKSKTALARLNIPPEEVMQLGESGNSWTSTFVVDGDFCVVALRDRIERASFPVCDGVFPWLKTIPLKILGFVWWAKQNRIPSAEALKDIEVAMPSTLCSACNEADESGDHILVSCSIAKEVFQSIFQWCKIRTCDFHSVASILGFAYKWGNCPDRRNVFTTIVFASLWCLWKARNERIFKKQRYESAKIISNIKTHTYV